LFQHLTKENTKTTHECVNRTLNRARAIAEQKQAESKRIARCSRELD